MRLLHKTDPAAVTRQMVAAEAGVDPNLIRYYFGNMSQLLLEVTVQANRRARAEMTENRHTLSMENRIRLKIDRTFHLFSDNPFLHKLVTTVLEDEGHEQAQAEWHATLREAVEDVTDALKQDGRITEDVSEKSRFIHLLIVSACEFWTNNHKIVDKLFEDEEGKEQLAKRYVNFIGETILLGIIGNLPKMKFLTKKYD